MHPLKKLVTHLYRRKDTVCITSSPRSGSTWLAEMLVQIGGFDWVNEPLRLLQGKHDPLYEQGIRARTCLIDADARRVASVTSIMSDVLDGRIGYLQLSPRVQRRLLLKFVRMNRMLAWVTQDFELQHNLLLVRHPCAVVASQLAMHGSNSVWSKIKQPAPDIPRYLRQRVMPLVNEDPHRNIAINWALDQRIPLYDYRPDNTLLVFYEDLMAHPYQEWKRISQFCGVDFKTVQDRASATASQDFFRETQTSKWKEQLSPHMVDDILSTCHELGVNVYTTDLMPTSRPW